MRESEQRRKLLKNKEMYIQKRPDGIQKNLTVREFFAYAKNSVSTSSRKGAVRAYLN